MTTKKDKDGGATGEKVTVGEEISAVTNAPLPTVPLARRIADVCMPCGMVLGVREAGEPRPDYMAVHASPGEEVHNHPVVVQELDASTVLCTPAEPGAPRYAVMGRPLE